MVVGGDKPGRDTDDPLGLDPCRLHTGRFPRLWRKLSPPFEYSNAVEVGRLRND